MSAQDIVLIIGAVFLGLSQLLTLWQNKQTNQKLDVSAERREVIAQAIIDPAVTSLPPAPPKA